MRRRQRRRRAGGGGPSSVNLISMMDILTVLLLFLLKSYVAGGEVMVPAAGVNLPTSTAEKPPQSSLVVAIDTDEIMVGGERVASLSEAMQGSDLLIAPLAARLRHEHRQKEEIAKLQGRTAPPSQAATIQCDRELEFRVLKRVMFTLHESGFGSIALAVLQKA